MSKTADLASSTIFLAANSGTEEFKSAVIEVADERTGVPKLRLTLTSVILTSYSINTNAAEGRGPNKSFTLNYAGAEWNSNPVAEEKAEETLHTGFFSLKAAKEAVSGKITRSAPKQNARLAPGIFASLTLLPNRSARACSSAALIGIIGHRALLSGAVKENGGTTWNSFD